MVRILRNKQNKIFIIVWFALISFFTASFFADASVKETDNIDDVNIQMSTVQQPQKQTQHIDSFTIAIIGVSIGCMLIVSSLHFSITRRRELEAQIITCGAFLISSCSVECVIKDCSDNDPMMTAVKDIQGRRDANLEKYENQKKVMVRSISDIETEIISLWG